MKIRRVINFRVINDIADSDSAGLLTVKSPRNFLKALCLNIKSPKSLVQISLSPENASINYKKHFDSRSH